MATKRKNIQPKLDTRSKNCCYHRHSNASRLLFIPHTIAIFCVNNRLLAQVLEIMARIFICNHNLRCPICSTADLAQDCANIPVLVLLWDLRKWVSSVLCLPKLNLESCELLHISRTSSNADPNCDAFCSPLEEFSIY